MRRRALQTAGRRHLLDMTLPVAAFFAGRKVSDLLKRDYEDLHFEDLWQPYFCISTNLTRAEMVVHEEGWLWRAVRASIAIPGIYPPMLASNGDVLVDGGLMNNMPIDLMRARPDVGTVIGVNCSPIQGDTRAYRFGSSVSGWRAVTGRLARRRTAIDAPNLMSTIMRSTEVRSTAVARSDAFRSHADLIIEPDVKMYGRLDFARCDAAIDAGYRAASTSLDAWLSSRRGDTSGGQEP
jgi:predicted acylesterase/phospholipase RssA